jgi:phosphoglycolate phosphatase-like HAD superfamily hydrolase
MDDLDIRDILLEVEADLTEMIEEVLKELQLPMMKQALRVRWMTMPDDLKEQLRDEQPQVYEQIMRMVDEERSY